MIINNMEEFGKALDDGKQMELFCDGLWYMRGFETTPVRDIRTNITQGRIRTKPKTTYFRLARDKETKELVPYESDEPFVLWIAEGPQELLFDHTLESEE